MTLFAYVWEYRVHDDELERFQKVYGPGGDWVQLFKKAEGYVRTDLFRDADGSYLYIKKIENVLEKGKSRVSLPLEAVPVLAIPVAELASKTLTHQEGFVLSRVNDDWNIGSILKICPMSEDEVGAIFRRLQGSGIIAIAEQSDSRGVVPINDAAPEIPIRR